MPYTFTVTNDSPQALDFIRFIKNLDFIEVTEIKDITAPPQIVEEDEDGMPLAYKDFILDLSKKTKKAAAKRFYKKVAPKIQT